MKLNRARLAALGVLAACFVVGAVFTFPLILKLTTHFPSSPADEDVFAFIWNNWWISHSILERHQSPLTTNFLFSPFGIRRSMGRIYDILSIWKERAERTSGRRLPAGHNLQEEAPDQVLAELQAFLK